MAIQVVSTPWGRVSDEYTGYFGSSVSPQSSLFLDLIRNKEKVNTLRLDKLVIITSPASVPASKLSADGSLRPLECGKISVFIGSRYGYYDVTLGLGSGKIISQIVVGEQTDLDVSNSALS